MSTETAVALWGLEAVRRALAEPEPEDVTAELACDVGRRAESLGALRAWALAQPWPRFCAIVRIVSGELRREVEKAGRES